MNDTLSHQPWCRERVNHQDGSSWYCSRTIHETSESDANVLVEVTAEPGQPTRLNLFADLDRSLTRPEARDIAIAILVGSDLLEGWPAASTPTRRVGT